jgi:hypothetical protein
MTATTTTKPSRKPIFNLEEDTIDEATDKIIKRLTIYYCMLQSEKSVDDFVEDVIRPLSESTAANPAAVNVTTYTKQSERSIRAFMTLIVRSCAHCLEAAVADEAGLQLRAWNQVASAAFQLGTLEGFVMVEPAMAFIQASRGSEAAKTRNEKYTPLREHAVNLARQGSFRTKRQAALGVKEAVLAEASKLGIYLSEQQAERTITTWLEKLAFGPKRQP